jgi:hypothetical protein
MKDPVETLGEVAGDVIHRLVRELLARRPGGHLVEQRLEQLDVHLPLALSGADADPSRFARELVRSLEQLIDDAVEQAAAFRPGRAYCHRCESASCEHGLPPSCRHVFIGYAQTGMPKWEDFAQRCLELKHPEVDRLFDDPPAFLTLVQDRRELHDGMLQAFRNGAYELMGQVVAGFFPVRARAEEGRGVLALSVQAAASRSRRGPPRIGLNLLGRAPGGEELDAMWGRLDDLPWRKAVRWAQGALQTLGSRRRARGSRAVASRNDRAALEHRVQGIMRGLARRLERDQRARTRRTRHAEQRHASGQRPTRKAIDDARAVGPGSLRVDERSGTLVVLGDRGRTHFFTPGGQHVSSVRYSKDAIERKIKIELWRPATGEELAALRARVGDASRTADPETESDAPAGSSDSHGPR